MGQGHGEHACDKGNESGKFHLVSDQFLPLETGPFLNFCGALGALFVVVRATENDVSCIPHQTAIKPYFMPKRKVLGEVDAVNARRKRSVRNSKVSPELPDNLVSTLIWHVLRLWPEAYATLRQISKQFRRLTICSPVLDIKRQAAPLRNRHWVDWSTEWYRLLTQNDGLGAEPDAHR